MAIECCICTEVLLKAETIVSSTPCGHLYHTHCLLEWIEKCENGANCPVCRQTFPQSEIVAVNAANDEEVETLAKNIAEKFTIKENNDGNRTVNSPIIVIPASLNYRIDTDSDDDFDYYDQDSGDERDDFSEIFRDYDDHLYDNDNFSNPGDFNDDIDDDLENDEAEEEENIEVQSNGSMEDWDVESNGSSENSVENQDIGSNESAEDLNDGSGNEHIQSEAESDEEQQSVDLNDNDSYGSGNDDNDEEINYQSDDNDDFEGVNDDFDDADDYDYGDDDDDDDDYNGNDDYDDYSD